MNEEELKKGCGLGFDVNNKQEDVNVFYPYQRCGKFNYLCPTCQARLEGFQKGKLEQKKEELKFLKERCIYCMIADERIKQLQKEIREEKQDENS